MEGWEEWKGGKNGEWKDGRMEGWKSVLSTGASVLRAASDQLRAKNFPAFQSSILPTLPFFQAPILPIFRLSTP
jgi:hypothetical protein